MNPNILSLAKIRILVNIKTSISSLLTYILILLSLLLYTLACKPQLAQAAGESWLTGYSYRRQITIDNSKVSDLDSADFNNFPVLISLSGLSNIRDNGIDIRFTTSDGITQLPREIESYSSGALVAWVKMPILDYNDDTIIYMYYGNAEVSEPVASSEYGSQNVWTNNYVGVWHLKETSANETVTDSSSNANNSSSQTWTPTAGKINGAGSFNGSSNSVNITSNTGLNPAAITVSGWANANVNNKWQHVVVKNGQWNFGRDNDGKYYLAVWNASTNVADEHSTATATIGDWEHIVFTYDGTAAKYYVNNNVVINKAVTGDLKTTTNAVNIGSQGGDGNFWNGLIDDIKISNIARSAGWIATEYNNQNAPATFTTTSDEEVAPTPTLTPTPTSTPTPTPTPSETNTSSNTSTPSAPSCTSSKPAGSPDLFQIETTTNSATLYFAPVNGISKYYISYSSQTSAIGNGVEVNLGNSGVQNYTINSLFSNTTYYFRVRGQNDCMPGDWSSIKSAATQADSNNFISHISNQIMDKIQPEKNLEIVSHELKNEATKKDDEDQSKNQQTGVNLNVVIKDNNNQPLKDVTVTLHSKVQTAITDEQGIAHFTNVESGEHQVLLAYNDYKGEQSLIIDDSAQEQTLTIQVNMTNSMFSLPMLSILAVMTGLIILLFFLLFKKRHNFQRITNLT